MPDTPTYVPLKPEVPLIFKVVKSPKTHKIREYEWRVKITMPHVKSVLSYVTFEQLWAMFAVCWVILFGTSYWSHIDGFTQEGRNPFANALDITLTS